MTFHERQPNRTHRLQVSALHEIHVEEYGNPAGKPAVILHGGPGAGISAPMSRFHDPDTYRIIVFDQRGCGRSTPHAELEENTTWDLVADMEAIRQHLGIDRWQVFGGSWGACLALAYAETYPDRVTELILRGIFTHRQSEITWFYQFGASEVYPEAFGEFQAPIPPAERSDMLSAYHRRLIGKDRQEQTRCALTWTRWEAKGISLLPDSIRVNEWSDPAYARAFARIETHYFINRGFFEQDGQLLAHAGRLANIPGIIVQGRYDMCTPMTTAYDLHQAWPTAEFRVVEDAGHAMTEPGIAAELVRATQSFASGD